MISAPNHLPPLSGNNSSLHQKMEDRTRPKHPLIRSWSVSPTLTFILFLFAVGIISSCGAGKTKTPPPEIITPEGKKVYNSKTGKYEFVTQVTGKVDTIQWTDAGTMVKDPIDSDPSQYLEEVESSSPTNGNENPNTPQLLANYNVVIMIPFNTHRTDAEGSIHGSSLSAISFYEGAKMALEKLENEGLNMKVTVMDTKRSAEEVDNLLTRSELLDAHLIIGPYSSKPLTKVADFAKENQKILISPINTGGDITKDNPNFIQANPSLKSHCEAILKHALRSYATDQIVLVCRNKDVEVNRLKYFQDANLEIAGTTTAPPLTEYIIDATLADEFGELENLPTYIQEDRQTVFIVPSYSNETFISNFMRQLEISKGDNEVLVYGMPRWMEYDRIQYDYYERLNLHVSCANYADNEVEAIQIFRRNFFDKYGTIPDDNAYKGYDLT
ncbi:MAG: ABC transporter substrate-binding protein, partial [Bacteroidota bacterium]